MKDAVLTVNINVLGKGGQKNQQGRLVHIFPKSQPGFLMTRIVESGSGYITQNQYELLVGSNEPHHVIVRFPEGITEFDILPGECMEVRRGHEARACSIRVIVERSNVLSHFVRELQLRC